MHDAAAKPTLSAEQQRIAQLEAELAAAKSELVGARDALAQLRRAYTRALEQLQLLRRRLFVAKAERAEVSAEQLAFDSMFLEVQRLEKALDAAERNTGDERQHDDPKGPKIDEIVSNFELLDEWEERYRYLIELGRLMEPLPDAAYNDVNKVQGCASQVWLQTDLDSSDGEPVLRLRGDSDAHIVRGLVALLISLYSGRTASEALSTDALALFKELGLSEHLTPQRSNGVRSMVERIRRDAQMALAAS